MKTPHTDIRIHGDIPPRILDALKSEYGAGLKIYEGDEECVDVKETDWYSGLNVSPGDVLRVYRENAGLTQTRLGEMLGTSPGNAFPTWKTVAVESALTWQKNSQQSCMLRLPLSLV